MAWSLAPRGLRGRTLARAVAIALLVLLAWFGSGCPKPPPVVGGGVLIDDIELEGVERFGKSELLRHLLAGEYNWFPFSPDYPHDEALRAVDAERIEALYAAYGYHHARVERIETLVDEDDDEVDLRIVVHEGEPTLVRSLVFAWAPDAPVPDDVRAAVEAGCTLAVDGPMEVDRFNDALGTMRLELLSRGYPLAATDGGVEVYADSLVADVRFDLSPGPYATIGAVDYVGLVDVPAYMVEVETRFAVGAPYSPATARAVEEAMRGMRVFRWVAAKAPTEVRDGQVTLVVQVSEADPESIKLGLELGVDQARWQEYLRIAYTHTNLFGHLTRLDLEVLAGWAELPNPWDPKIHGPVVRFAPTFTKKGLGEEQLLWTLAPAFEMDVHEGYQYWSPENWLGVTRWFGNVVTLGLGHRFRYVDFFNVSPDLEQNGSLLGRDFRDPFVLSALEAQVSAYLVNDVLAPTDGAIFDLKYALSGSFFGSGYDFHQVDAGVRMYWKPWSRLQIAARVQTGLILPFGAKAGSPFSHKYYLGGSNTVRGWGSRRLAPRIEECKPDELDPTAEPVCDKIPIGGDTLIQANLEFRFFVVWKLYLVAFFDMGDVQKEAATFKPEEWNTTAGAGVRIDSPIGIVRLDFGYRLNDPGVYPDEKRWGIHFGLGEAF